MLRLKSSCRQVFALRGELPLAMDNGSVKRCMFTKSTTYSMSIKSFLPWRCSQDSAWLLGDINEAVAGTGGSWKKSPQRILAKTLTQVSCGCMYIVGSRLYLRHLP